ncbi:RNA-directed DNA polymerase, eukaryota [Tanacetum coccineum]
MSSATSAVTYTSVYTDSEPGRAFWGADDEEISEGGIPRVIVLGYDGLPMQPVAPPSPDYIPGPEDPQTPPVPQDEDEREPMFVQAHDPDYVPEPIYPDLNLGDYINDANDEDEEEEEEEEEEHLALADSAVVVPTDEPVSPPEGTELVIPPPSTDITIGARITVRPQTSISLPPEAEVERLLAMTTPSPSPLIHGKKNQRRLQNYCCDDWREAQDVKILEAYDHTLPQKEKDPGSFTLPCFIHNVCFDKALVDLGASVSVMPFSTYTNLGLGILSHTRLTIELADRTIKQPRGIAENVLVRIGKFIFPIDFIILDIPEDDDVPLILGRPFFSTAHSKIDVYKRKITLGVWEEKLVFKSFIIIDDEDVTSDVALGMPFFMKFMSCQMIMKKFAYGDKYERIMNK